MTDAGLAPLAPRPTRGSLRSPRGQDYCSHATPARHARVGGWVGVYGGGVGVGLHSYAWVGSVVGASSVGLSSLAARAEVCILSGRLSRVPASVVVRSAPRVGLLPCPPRRFAPAPPPLAPLAARGLFVPANFKKEEDPSFGENFATVGGRALAPRPAPPRSSPRTSAGESRSLPAPRPPLR